MRRNVELTINVPGEIADAIRQKVASGAYASEGEVVCEGIHAIETRDADVERWLREEVLAGHEEFLRDPSRGVEAQDMLDIVRKRYGKIRGG
ncbi:MAG: type II toxin-antitoxin system ParD family antitoxin [Beijerinckiaceae bacterium]